MEEKIIEVALKELEDLNFGITRQFLEVHKLVYENKIPKIERVDIREKSETAFVYFRVKDVSFFLVVFVNLGETVFVKWVDIMANYEIYFQAQSKIYSCDELLKTTYLKPTKSWNKGEFIRNGKIKYKFSAIEFNTTPYPDTFDNKLEKLLSFLENDVVGIKLLSEKSDCFVRVVTSFHNGNGMFSGPYLSKEFINRLHNLHTHILFDFFIEGNLFKD